MIKHVTFNLKSHVNHINIINDTNNNSSVFNLSDLNISNELTQLLNHGVNFVPTPRRHHNIELMVHDIECFVRKVKLNYYFQKDNQPKRGNEVAQTLVLSVTSNSLKNIKQLKLPSKWTPPTARLSREQRLSITSVLRLPYITKPVNNRVNISKNQFIALNQLKHNNNIIVSPADKGGATVLWNRSNYLNEGYRQLNDNKYYKRINVALTSNNYDSLFCILKRMLRMGQISHSQFTYLLRPSPSVKQRRFYLLPKIHKPVEKWTDANTPPGRPIVSDVDSESYYTAKSITLLLAPFPSTLDSFVKNSFEFKQRICSQPFNNDYILVTADIDSLYTNMNIDRCMHVTRQYLSSFLDIGLVDNILQLLEINLKNNDFVFNHEIFLQTYGVAMGKSFTPPPSG